MELEVKNEIVMNEKELKKNFPSLDLAYEIAIDSYELLIKRIDALDSRLQNMLTFSITLLVAVPTVAKLREINFNSCCFVLGISYLIFSIVVAFYARLMGNIKVLKVKKIYENNLHLNESQFKHDIICWAQFDQEANIGLLKKMWELSVVSIILFALGLGLLALWVAVAVRV
jgi:hypothetical protein